MEVSENNIPPTNTDNSPSQILKTDSKINQAAISTLSSECKPPVVQLESIEVTKELSNQMERGEVNGKENELTHQTKLINSSPNVNLNNTQALRKRQMKGINKEGGATQNESKTTTSKTKKPMEGKQSEKETIYTIMISYINYMLEAITGLSHTAGVFLFEFTRKKRILFNDYYNKFKKTSIYTMYEEYQTKRALSNTSGSTTISKARIKKLQKILLIGLSLFVGLCIIVLFIYGFPDLQSRQDHPFFSFPVYLFDIVISILFRIRYVPQKSVTIIPITNENLTIGNKMFRTWNEYYGHHPYCEIFDVEDWTKTMFRYADDTKFADWTAQKEKYGLKIQETDKEIVLVDYEELISKSRIYVQQNNFDFATPRLFIDLYRNTLSMKPPCACLIRISVAPIEITSEDEHHENQKNLPIIQGPTSTMLASIFPMIATSKQFQWMLNPRIVNQSDTLVNVNIVNSIISETLFNKQTQFPTKIQVLYNLWIHKQMKTFIVELEEEEAIYMQLCLKFMTKESSDQRNSNSV